MKILYITNKPIFPVVDGGCKAMQQLLNCLLECNIEMKHICLSTHKHPFDLSYYPERLQKLFPIIAYPVDTKLKYNQAIKHLINRKSYNLSRFDAPEIHSNLKSEMKDGKYSHVILESLFLTPYIDTLKKYSKAKIIVRTHNVEHRIWEQLAKNASNPLKRWYLNRLAQDLKKQELEVLNKVDLLATISDSDMAEFQMTGITSEIITIPVAMDPQENKIDYSIQNLFFLGSMNWQPNIEAVEWLTSEIFPAVREKMPQTELHIAGSFMDQQFPTNKNKGIINHGFVEDSTAFMQNSGILVLPIQSGSGVRMKMLEAMSLGIPVVTTLSGAHGINGLTTVSLAENTSQFTNAILDLLESPEKRAFLGKKAYNFMEQNYSISTISKLLCDKIEKL